GWSFAPIRSLVFGGLDFIGAPGHAISGTTYVADIETRSCTFQSGHQSSALGANRHAVIVSENSGSDVGWHVHHNHITLSPFTSFRSYGIYVSHGGGWDIHHNEFALNGANYGIYLVSNNQGEDRIYNNLFTGGLYATPSRNHNDVAVIKGDSANTENYIGHNTFAVAITNHGCCVATAGFMSGSNTIQ